MTVQIYLSISRPDLAKKEYEAAKQHADDTLLVQLIEASIGVVVGGNPLRSAYHIYAEQASAPGSSSNAAIITSKGISQLLRGNLAEAEADIDEALRADPQNADALAASVVIAQLSGKKGGPDEALALVLWIYL